MSWAWSYVPSVSTIIGPMSENENDEQATDGQRTGEASSASSPKSIQCLIGLYFDEFNATFKLTQQISSSSMTTSASNAQPLHPSLGGKDDLIGKNYMFCPFINCNLKGNSLKN